MFIYNNLSLLSMKFFCALCRAAGPVSDVAMRSEFRIPAVRCVSNYLFVSTVLENVSYSVLFCVKDGFGTWKL